jgi:hypothetical protein
VTPNAPVGPLLVLAGLVAGIAVGEDAGPGAARVALVSGVVGVMIAAFVTNPSARVVIAVFAFALLGTAVMQRALHGLVASPLSTRFSPATTSRCEPRWSTTRMARDSVLACSFGSIASRSAARRRAEGDGVGCS